MTTKQLGNAALKRELKTLRYEMDQLAIHSVLHLVKTQRNGRHIDKHLEIVSVHIRRLIKNLIGQLGRVSDRLRGEHLIGLAGGIEG